MINNFIGILGFNAIITTNAIENIIKKTDVMIDQKNVQINIIIDNDESNLVNNLKYLKKIGSKEIFLVNMPLQTNVNKLSELLKVKIYLLDEESVNYIVKKYRNG